MEKEKIVLVNPLSPGDILVMTIAIRSLQKAYPDKYLIDTRTPAAEIFMNNPHITTISSGDPVKEREVIEELKKDENHPPIEHNGIKYIISHYPEIHRSGMTGLHFGDGHRMFLEKQLGIPIPRTGMRPDIFLTESELNEGSKVLNNYWIIDAGIKNDFTLKWYSHWQEVINILKDNGITPVQIGMLEHNHPPLDNVIDMRGKTNLRQLFRLIKDSDGVVTPISLPMHVAAALNKPCVVVAGGREGMRWEAYPDHQYIHRVGTMSCAVGDGCWKSKKEECTTRTDEGEAMCMELITPQEICDAALLYYKGGRITMDNSKEEEVKIMSEEDFKQDNSDKFAETMAGALSNSKNTDDYQPPVFESELIFSSVALKCMADSAILNTLRILKKHLPEDNYYEAYHWHLGKNGYAFMDTYHYLWYLGAVVCPRTILEIGSRTGISICQLLSAYRNYDDIERIVLIDNFSEQGSPEIIKHNLRVLNIPEPVISKIEIITGDSLEEVLKLQDEFDYILVDGCHEKYHAARDLRNVVPLCSDQGRILMDDLTPDGCSLQDVWDQFKEDYKEQFTFSENSNGKGVGVATKRS